MYIKIGIPLLVLLLFITPIKAQEHRGDVVSVVQLRHYTSQDMSFVYTSLALPTFLCPILFDVNVFKIVYRTPAATGDSLTLASGLVFTPISKTIAFPLLCYNHGTMSYATSLSDYDTTNKELLLAIPYAANGYVAVLPDYLGYGATPKSLPHPYIHAKSEASAIIDLIIATKAFCATQAVGLNSQLFLSGYSQGGHATMATMREIETNFESELPITAVAPGSGPYDVSGVMTDSLLNSNSTYSDPFYMSFITQSYKYVYSDIYGNISEMYKPPYDSIIPLIYDRANPQTSLISQLASPAYTMLQPAYIDSVKGHMDHPFRKALIENDVYDWNPKAPLRLFYCTSDDKIPAIVTVNTLAKLHANGAVAVEAIVAGTTQTHANCANNALLYTKQWFDTKRFFGTLSVKHNAMTEKFFVFPNPFVNDIQLQDSDEFSILNIYDMTGRLIVTKDIHLLTRVPLGELATGSYVFEFKAEDFNYFKVLVKQ